MRIILGASFRRSRASRHLSLGAHHIFLVRVFCVQVPFILISDGIIYPGCTHHMVSLSFMPYVLI